VDEFEATFQQALEDDDLVGADKNNRKEQFLRFCEEELLMQPFAVCTKLELLGLDVEDYVPSWLVRYYSNC